MWFRVGVRHIHLNRLKVCQLFLLKCIENVCSKLHLAFLCYGLFCLFDCIVAFGTENCCSICCRKIVVFLAHCCLWCHDIMHLEYCYI